ncbi:hypothetical protein BMH25_06900 [Leucobacter sp. OLCALW19]|nr:hypothetical protein BMH25_06900 [Leucobacter sp. OLCALW19]PII90647.1 hypothetical protein BMH27_09820 [Leucobacter sp. OLAS13]PII98350.1 hypothetical protein BMH28_12900 [Leucobacter sp. OLCS4]PII99638.1 hypothetical protein BMH29_03655 [Leucobacter sp. OLDS2]
MFESRMIVPDVSLRVMLPEDAPALSAASERNREHLAPWEPVRPEEFFTEEWQARALARRFASAAVQAILHG